MPYKLIAPGERGNRYYYVRGQIRGKRFEGSTRTTNKSLAEQRAAELVARISKGLSALEPETITFSDMALRYRNVRKLSNHDEKSLSTLENHMGDRLLSSITQVDVDQWAKEIYPSVKPQSRARRVHTIVAAVMNYAAESKLGPPIRFKRPRGEEPSRPAVVLEDGERMIAEATGEVKALLLCLVYQGWRITETLKIERANLGEGRIKRRVSKSDKWKWTPLLPEVAKALGKLPERDDGRIFSFRDRWQAYDAIKPIADKLKIKFSPHMARRGFATELLRRGADLKAIAAAGGWEDLKSVAIYAHADERLARATLTKLKTGGETGGKRKKRQ